MTYSYQQQLILAIVPKISASFGIPCEVFLMYLIYGDHMKGRANPMLRALFGVSFFGLCDAIGWFLSSWAVPEGSFALSAGSQASCDFQGFLLQFVIGAPLYSCAVAYYFHEVIVRKRSFDEILRKEWYVHAGIVLYALCTSVILLSLEQYNPIGKVCWIVGYPIGCGNSVYVVDPDAPDCERGNWAWALGMALFYIPLWCCIILILYFNFAIWIKLRHTTEGKWFATQSTLYALAFCITWAPSTIWSIATYKNAGGFGLDFVSALFEPLAGVWNLFIFLRNRHSIRRKIWNLLCCRCDLLEDQNSESDDIEGAPRKKYTEMNKSNDGTGYESGVSSRKVKHKKNKSSDISLTESEYQRKKEKKRRKKERKRREAEFALANERLTNISNSMETETKEDKEPREKSVLDHVSSKRKSTTTYREDNNTSISSTSTAPVAVINILGKGRDSTDFMLNDNVNDPDKVEKKAAIIVSLSDKKVAPDARLEI